MDKLDHENTNRNTCSPSGSLVDTAHTSETTQNTTETTQTRSAPEVVNTIEIDQTRDTLDTVQTENASETVEITNTSETVQTATSSETVGATYSSQSVQTVSATSQTAQCKHRCAYGCGREGSIHLCNDCTLYALITRSDVLSSPRHPQPLVTSISEILPQEYVSRLNNSLVNIRQMRESCSHIRGNRQSSSAPDYSRPERRRRRNNSTESCSRTRPSQSKRGCPHSELLKPNIITGVRQRNLSTSAIPSTSQNKPSDSPINTGNMSPNLNNSQCSDIDVSNASSFEQAIPDDSRMESAHASDVALNVSNISRHSDGSKADISNTVDTSQSMSPNRNNSIDNLLPCSGDRDVLLNPEQQDSDVDVITSNLPRSIFNSPPSSPPRICERCLQLRQETFVIVYFVNGNPGEEYEILNMRRIRQVDVEKLTLGTRVVAHFGDVNVRATIIMVSRTYEYLYLNFNLITELHRDYLQRLMEQDFPNIHSVQNIEESSNAQNRHNMQSNPDAVDGQNMQNITNAEGRQNAQNRQNLPNSPNAQYRSNMQQNPSRPNRYHNIVCLRSRWLRIPEPVPMVDRAVQTEDSLLRQADIEDVQERLNNLERQSDMTAGILVELKYIIEDILDAISDLHMISNRQRQSPRPESRSPSSSSGSRRFRPIHRDPTYMVGQDNYSDTTDPEEFGEPMEGPYPQRRYDGDVPEQLHRNGHNEGTVEEPNDEIQELSSEMQDSEDNMEVSEELTE